MTWLEAAERVLRESGSHKPMHYEEITRLAIKQGFIHPTGRTPAGSLTSLVGKDIRQREARGEPPRFVRHGQGLIRLAEELPSSPAAQIERRNRPVRGHTAAATRAAGSMSFADAAERVLRESGSHDPMHYEEIANRGIAKGYIQSEGKTPAGSLNSIVGTDIRQREARGEPPRFVRHGRGLIGLAEELPQGLAAQIDEHNRSVRGQVLGRLREGSPAEFEDLVAELLTKLGFEEVERTPLSGDGGIDVKGTLVIGNVVRLRMAVQAKRWKTNVTAPTVQQVRGSLSTHEQGLIITTSGFSTGARKEASRADNSPVALMDGEQLTDLLVEHEVGVEKKTYPLLQFLDSAPDSG